ncbi:MULTISPECIES: NACHT domain-containing protein [Pseudomonas]|uniref:NACHT domain-containing protein n=1 Tax=Pseudomonas azadiae TaxID=2843612 RepID=A0ABS6P1Z5_9PSED|nr:MULTISPECIES: NACHT domain-containing protein [Pseudomonas]MBV4454473.1 NACHT domain-containing protein [Pseudomonas azadiae]NMF41322.1 NACHT domain-containing protein [Pseudomonas sp. SWRI 103]
MATLTTAILTTALKPLITEIYSTAKASVKDKLKKLSLVQISKKIANQLIKLDKVKTIWSPESELSLQNFYFPSRLYIAGAPSKISSLSELPEGNLVIEGIVGQGKSIFMRYLAMSVLNDQEITVVPILVELRKISEQRSLASTIYTFLDTLSLPSDAEAFDYLASTGKIVLLLDGFDEIPAECVNDTIVELETIQAKHPNLKIVISSRPKSSIQNTTGFQVISLVQLSKDDYPPFLKKLISSTAKRLDIIKALDECSTHISGVICTPLMLTLVVIVHQTEQKIPATLPEFFDKLFGTVFSKHDRYKAGFNRQHYSGLSESELKKLFDAFCFMVVQGGSGRSLDTKAFNKHFEKASKYMNTENCGVENFRKDIVKIACLMLDEGYDTTTFLHKSILDYHAAAFVKALPDNTAKSFYKAAFNSYDTWKYPLDFLQTIDKTRYLQDYVVANLSTQIDEITKLINSKNEDSLIAFLESIQPEFNYSITAEYDFLQAGPFNPTRIELFETISNRVFEALMDSVDHSQKDKIDWAIKHTQGLESFPDESQSISIRTIIKSFGADLVWRELQSLETDTLLELSKAKKFLTEERDKNQFLEDILCPSA